MDAPKDSLTNLTTVVGELSQAISKQNSISEIEARELLFRELWSLTAHVALQTNELTTGQASQLKHADLILAKRYESTSVSDFQAEFMKDATENKQKYTPFRLPATMVLEQFDRAKNKTLTKRWTDFLLVFIDNIVGKTNTTPEVKKEMEDQIRARLGRGTTSVKKERLKLKLHHENSEALIEFLDDSVSKLAPVFDEINATTSNNIWSGGAALLRTNIFYYSLVVANVDYRLAREELGMLIDLYSWSMQKQEITTVDEFKRVADETIRQDRQTFFSGTLQVPAFLAEVDQYDKLHNTQHGVLFRTLFLRLAEAILSSDGTLAVSEEEWVSKLRDALAEGAPAT